MLSLIEGREGVLTVFAEGQEARGSGEATATVRVSVADGAEDGTAVVRFTGDLSATGRLTEFDEETLDAAGRRLLDRFATALASPDAEPEPESESESDGDGDGDGESDTETGGEAEGGTGTDAGVVFIEEHQDQPGDDLDDDLSDLIAFSDADAERFGLPTGGGDGDGPGEGVAEEAPRRAALRVRGGAGGRRPGAPQHRRPVGRGGGPRAAARAVRPGAADP